MNRILFPTDFSPASLNAFTYALGLAQALNAKIDLINVYRLPVVDATNVPPDYLSQLFEEKRAAITESLNKFYENAEEELIGDLEAIHGIFVPEEIIAYSSKRLHRLIVMGTRGEHLSRFEKFMGSITTNTLLNAKCPVLAVPIDCVWTPIRRITYATDLLSNEQQAVETTRLLAAELHADVDFVHIETKPKIGDWKEKVTLDDYPFPDTKLKVINSPSVLEGLNNYITEKSVDLLAMFVPKRGPLERLFHSSFTKKMTFHTNTPLLVFHEQTDDDVEE